MSPVTLGIIAERLENHMASSSKQFMEAKLAGQELKIDVNVKHVENRDSIHKIRNAIQESNDELSGKINKLDLEVVSLKVKLAMYSAIGGIIAGSFTAIITSVIHSVLGR